MLPGFGCDYSFVATHDSDSRTVPAPPSALACRRARRLVERGHGSVRVTDPDKTTTYDPQARVSAQQPPKAYRRAAAASSSSKRSNASSLAWAQAYLTAGDPQAALVLFFEILANTSIVSDPSFDRSNALQFAERVANVFLNRGDVDKAAELLRFMAVWDEHTFASGPPMTSERTVVAKNPLLAEEQTVAMAPARDLTGNLTIDPAFDDQLTTVRPVPGEQTTVFRGATNRETAVRVTPSRTTRDTLVRTRARPSARRLSAP